MCRKELSKVANSSACYNLELVEDKFFAESRKEDVICKGGVFEEFRNSVKPSCLTQKTSMDED